MDNIIFENGRLFYLDQTLLPNEEKLVEAKTKEEKIAGLSAWGKDMGGYSANPELAKLNEEVFKHKTAGYDAEGKEYLDFGAGIAVFALGYNDKEYSDALKAQIDKLIHTSNLFYNIPAAKAAEKLVKASGLSKAFFTK